MNCPGFLQNQSIQNGYAQSECILSGRFPVGCNGYWHSGMHARGRGDKKIYPIIKGHLVAYSLSDIYTEFSLMPELSEDSFIDLDSCDTYLYERMTINTRNNQVKYVLKDQYQNFKYLLGKNFVMLRHTIDNSEGDIVEFFTLYVGIAPPKIEEKIENRISCREGYMPFIEIEKDINEPAFYETYEFRVKNTSVEIYDSPGENRSGDAGTYAQRINLNAVWETLTLVNASRFRENFIAQIEGSTQYVHVKNVNGTDGYLYFKNNNITKNSLDVRIVRKTNFCFNGNTHVCGNSAEFDLNTSNLLGFTLPRLPPAEPNGPENYHASRYDLVLMLDNVNFLNTRPFNNMGDDSFFNVGEINKTGTNLWRAIESKVEETVQLRQGFWQRVLRLFSETKDWFSRKYPNESLESRNLKRRIICRHPLEWDISLLQYRREREEFKRMIRATDIWEGLKNKIIVGLNSNRPLATNMFWFSHPIYFIEQLEKTEIIKKEFKMPYFGTYWNQFTLTRMKGFNRTPGYTQCNFFIHHIARELGVFKDIFPKTVFNDNYSLLANNIGIRFSERRIPCMVFIEPITQEEFEEIPFEKRVNLTNDIKIESAKKAHSAQQKANEGYLVIAVCVNASGQGHIAVVGPQWLTYAPYPTTNPNPGLNDPISGTTGNAVGQGILRQYPVFVQAGTFTGIINPSHAFNSAPLDNNLINYYIYKPEEYI